jgi:hypothetical protein
MKERINFRAFERNIAKESMHGKLVALTKTGKRPGNGLEGGRTKKHQMNKPFTLNLKMPALLLRGH